MQNVVKDRIISQLKDLGIKDPELVLSPNQQMGDLAMSCFQIAKAEKINPVEKAKEIAEKINKMGFSLVERAENVGPYVNFFLKSSELVRAFVFVWDKKYGQHDDGKKEKIMVEFAHPNTHKAFHAGHLRNLITGESLVRVLTNSGFNVIRANYQGDVGMHIAKCLWGIEKMQDGFKDIIKKDLRQRIGFLGKAYAFGSQEYEKNDPNTRDEILQYNDKIYSNDKSIKKLYKQTRQWSLDYFDQIYKRLGAHFDRLYFESEVFFRGKEIVLDFLKKGVFKESQGAIIFEGSKYGLHDRVFVNSKGFPIYEAKDQALAEMQFKEFSPEKIYHIVASEQSDYFKVMFKALEQTLPQSIGKEFHLIYGWLSLKHGKMSSRTGQVLLGEWLVDEVKNRVLEIMKTSQVADKESVAEKVALAAVKYAILRTDISKDIVFDINESISLSGDSGPYLLYICARIKGILRKHKKRLVKFVVPEKIEPEEKQLVLRLTEFVEVTKNAAQNTNPSEIAKYLFTLAQSFNSFYHACPVLQAEGDQKSFRLHLISMVEQVMEKGLNLLGIQTVEEM